ncbi:heavy metal translocating P-type ATPase [Candidatus Syntrophocurvum alkaliphilum]
MVKIDKLALEQENDYMNGQNNKTSIRKEFILEGLGCASCATKMEEKINMLDGVSRASINFFTKTLILDINDPSKFDKIIFSSKNIIKNIESFVELVDKDEKERLGYEKNLVNNFSSILANKQLKLKVARIAIATVIFLFAMVLDLTFVTQLTLFIAAYLIVGTDILLRAVNNIRTGQVFDENFLLSVATIGAFAIQQYPEAVAVMIFFQTGDLLQDIAVNRSRESIADLMDIRPDYANLMKNGSIVKVSPEQIKINDIIAVKPGEKIPLDGIISEGSSMIDTKALTGESIPRDVSQGGEVLAGSINLNGLLHIKVTKEFEDSTVSKILELVENASTNKAPTENFITKFAKVYTPIVVFAAIAIAIIPPLAIPGASFNDWIYRALIFLVISCPCALVLSIPLGFFAGIGSASKKGILVKGGNYLEALNFVDTIVFDKTGTLTKGNFKVTSINPINTVSGDELLELAAYAESFSNHPIASSILEAYGKQPIEEKINHYEEISGHGNKIIMNDTKVVVGNYKLMLKENIECEEINQPGTIVYVAINGQYVGYIMIADTIKEDSKDTIDKLKKFGINKTVMLTGDNQSVGLAIGNSLGIDEVYAELLPHQKVEQLEKLDSQKGENKHLAFIGDGINDAPVLARADIGIAMGGIGSDAAIEAADVVLMTDEPSKLLKGLQVAKKTKTIVWQNIVFALGIKALVLSLGVFGLATMWAAIFADVGVSILAILNSMRILMSE